MGEDPSLDAAPPPGLEAFLTSLRAEGVAVGTGEIAWLRHAFAQAPELDGPALRALLACTLIKDQAQRPAFDALFDDWHPKGLAAGEPPGKGLVTEPPAEAAQAQAAATAKKAGATDDQRKAPTDKGPRLAKPRGRQGATAARLRHRFPYRTRLVAELALLVVVALSAGLYHWDRLTQPVTEPPQLKMPSQAPTVTPDTKGLRTVSALPENGETLFNPGATSVRWKAPALTIVVMGLLAAGWGRYRRQRALPEPEPQGTGPRQLPLLPIPPGGLELVDPEALRAMVWGIGRFVSDDLTTQVDTARTVAATARVGGLPELRFQHAVYPREVWLWQDAAAEGPSLERLAEELEQSLTRAGLPVRHGWFADIPDPVRWREGEEFSPLVLEGHRQSALVAVLTDGAGLGLVQESDLERPRLTALLQCLAQWPRLIFVDTSQGATRLAERLRPYQIDCIAPEALPAFLGEGRVGPAPQRRTQPALLGALQAWAGATTLASEPVDAATAYGLRRTLALPPALRFEDLLHNGQDRGGRLVWPAHSRIRLLAWLAAAEAGDKPGSPAPNTLLARALAYWRERYRRERTRRRSQDNPLLPWQHTAAEQTLRLEEALLDLWDAPDRATRTLYRLFRGDFSHRIPERLAAFIPQDWRAPATTEHVPLPWAWRERREGTRWMLARMGLGGKGFAAPSGELRPSGTLALATGLCLGAALAGLAAVLWPPQERQWTDPKTGMTFVRLAGGTFRMGSETSDEMAFDNEHPPHQVTVPDFWISKHEVTNQQYRLFVEKHEGADNLPAAYVDWNKAKQFCEQHDYRLPTEAQWEYAARAGTTSRWSFGDDEKQLGEYAWFYGNSKGQIHPVGTKSPNAWGLHDMHGNVWEWVEDCYDENAYSRERPPDPVVVGKACSSRVSRGGSAWDDPRYLRSAFRGTDRPANRFDGLGFRCVRVPRRQLDY